ncbi:hypothetical protein LWI28_028783 [Acer negundo]|uniref:Gag protein n=1 Tax=Acer negundo TaxID=4023 RepID=A0AAD5IPA6_ACENE|nr:hypothetical protein LWI28_028783 [Acer negundo]
MVSKQNSNTFSIPMQADSTQPLFTQGSRLLNPHKLELTIKLDHNNFLLWRQQIIAAIKGNRFFHFIDPNSEIPSKKKVDGTDNESYLDWEQQDQILLCWLLSSINQELLPQLVECTTACEAWYTVERLFTSQSRANVMQLKLQLQTLKKSGSTMTEYLIEKKNIMDSLAYSGYILSEDDKIMYILGGLGADYDSFVIPITSMPNTYSIPGIIALLITHEARIEQHIQTDVTHTYSQMQAMLAASETVSDPLWYPDGGATDHCTLDASNLNSRTDYNGKEKIYVGNGADTVPSPANSSNSNVPLASPLLEQPVSNTSSDRSPSMMPQNIHPMTTRAKVGVKPNV